MASPSDDLFAAIDAGDVDRVGAMLDVDPPLAMARDREGVSALLRARYRLDRALAEAVKARVAALDSFDAAQRAGGHRCTRRRTTATRGRSSSCSHGADPAAIDDEGRSVADMAAESA